MSPLQSILLYTMLAGLALPLGGAIARIERLQPAWLEKELRHGILAFGGGILLAAVSLVLIPEGIDKTPPLVAVSSLVIGGLAFLFIHRALNRSGKAVSNFLAAILDFVPEAIALGALISEQPDLGALLALLIGLQNLPEGFNAYREMTERGSMRANHVLGSLAVAPLLGPAAALLGFFLLADLPAATGSIMLAASGGILYLIFQDVAPQAKLSRHWGPPLGAVLGFTLGVAGHMLLRG